MKMTKLNLKFFCYYYYYYYFIKGLAFKGINKNVIIIIIFYYYFSKNALEEKENIINERNEIKHRNELTDEEIKFIFNNYFNNFNYNRKIEEKRSFDQSNAEEKKKWKFLQKYYHKGAFFMVSLFFLLL
jgi:uncharacterized membrane protein